MIAPLSSFLYFFCAILWYFSYMINFLVATFKQIEHIRLFGKYVPHSQNIYRFTGCDNIWFFSGIFFWAFLNNKIWKIDEWTKNTEIWMVRWILLSNCSLYEIVKTENSFLYWFNQNFGDCKYFLNSWAWIKNTWPDLVEFVNSCFGVISFLCFRYGEFGFRHQRWMHIELYLVWFGSFNVLIVMTGVVIKFIMNNYLMQTKTFMNQRPNGHGRSDGQKVYSILSPCTMCNCKYRLLPFQVEFCRNKFDL